MSQPVGQVLQAFLDECKSRYYTFSPTERLGLHALIFILCVAFVFYVVWQPISDWHYQKKVQYESNQQLINWMKKQEGKLAHVPKGKKRSSNQSLVTLVTRTSQSYQVPLVRYEPKGSTGVRVWLDNVVFNKMIKWLEVLDQQYSIKAVNISIDKQEGSGRVKATIVLVG